MLSSCVKKLPQVPYVFLMLFMFFLCVFMIFFMFFLSFRCFFGPGPRFSSGFVAFLVLDLGFPKVSLLFGSRTFVLLRFRYIFAPGVWFC